MVFRCIGETDEVVILEAELEKAVLEFFYPKSGNKRQFIKWWDSLSTKLKHYYVDRLESGKSLLPDELPGIPDIPKETNHLKMTIVNDKLALSSVEKDVLDRAKEMIEAVRGPSKYEYRTTRNGMGEKIHTYIFDLK